MMNLLEKFVLLLAVMFFVVTLGFMSYCIAAINQRCYPMLQPATCASAANTSCQNQGDLGQGSLCWTCNSNAVYPQNVCAAYELSICTEQVFYPCGNSEMWQGNCGRYNGSFACVNMVKIQPSCTNAVGSWSCNP
jgi:hypothetical protein